MGRKINNQVVIFSFKGETTKVHVMEDTVSSFMHTKWQPTSRAAWIANRHEIFTNLIATSVCTKILPSIKIVKRR